MWAYIARRILLTVPIVIGILIVVMILFSVLVKDPALSRAVAALSAAGFEVS